MIKTELKLCRHSDATFGAKDKRYKDKGMAYVCSICYSLAKHFRH